MTYRSQTTVAITQGMSAQIYLLEESAPPATVPRIKFKVRLYQYQTGQFVLSQDFLLLLQN